MNKERWNSDQMCYSNSEEFQYLDEVGVVTKQAAKIYEYLKGIERAAHWNIRCDDEKDMVDFTEIKSKLSEVQKLIDEL